MPVGIWIGLVVLKRVQAFTFAEFLLILAFRVLFFVSLLIKVFITLVVVALVITVDLAISLLLILLLPLLLVQFNHILHRDHWLI